MHKALRSRIRHKAQGAYQTTTKDPTSRKDKIWWGWWKKTIQEICKLHAATRRVFFERLLTPCTFTLFSAVQRQVLQRLAIPHHVPLPACRLPPISPCYQGSITSNVISSWSRSGICFSLLQPKYRWRNVQAVTARKGKARHDWYRKVAKLPHFRYHGVGLWSMNLTSASRHWNDLRLLVEPRHQARTCVSASFRPHRFMPAVKQWILHFQRLQIICLGSLYGFVA